MFYRSKQFASLLSVSCLLLGLNSEISVFDQDNSRKAIIGQLSKSQENSLSFNRAFLWQEPIDIESRNLFYGIGGEAGAPNAAEEFIFVRRKGSPLDSSEKIIVIDSQQRKWTVKVGAEAQAEVTATRIVWAAGYHVDQDFLLQQAHIKGRGDFAIRNARFERDDDGFKTVSRWHWKANSFVGTRELQGLKVLMALLNNWDLSEANNKVVRRDGDDVEANKHIYYVSDLGASLGNTGSTFNRIPIWADTATPDARGDAEAFANHPFIEAVENGRVIFHWRRKFGKDNLEDITVENARWMGNLLARLSEAQIRDAFRAGGFTDAEIAIYVSAIRQRIQQLQKL